MSLLELWDRSRCMTPAAQQRWLREHLARAAYDAGLRTATHHRDACHTGIVLGIAHYSRYDIEALEDAIISAREKAHQIEVFWLTDCATQADIEAYIPTLTPVFQSPVVGIWKDGLQPCCAQGYEARRLLRELRARCS